MDALKEALKKALMEIAQEQSSAEEGMEAVSGMEETDAKEKAEESDEMAPSLDPKGLPMEGDPAMEQKPMDGNMDMVKALADSGNAGRPMMGLRERAAGKAKGRLAEMMNKKK